MKVFFEEVYLMNKTLLECVMEHSVTIAHAGLGSAGLYQAYELAAQGYYVHAYDPNRRRIAAIRSGSLSDPDLCMDQLLLVQRKKKLNIYDDLDEMPDKADIVTLSVPSGLECHVAPDPLLTAGRILADRYSGSGQVWINRSTCAPGTTRALWRDVKFPNLVFSAERREIGHRERRIPICIASTTELGSKVASYLLAPTGSEIISSDSLETCELSKLLENAYRYMNIAFVNALSRSIPSDMLRKAIDIAATKPFGFMPFYPGAGVGGPYQSGAVRQLISWIGDSESCSVLLMSMALYSEMLHMRVMASRVAECARSVGARSIHFITVSWRNGVSAATVNDSPRVRIMAELLQDGWSVSYFDRDVSSLTIDGHELISTELLPEESSYVLVVTPTTTINDQYPYVYQL